MSRSGLMVILTIMLLGCASATPQTSEQEASVSTTVAQEPATRPAVESQAKETSPAETVTTAEIQEYEVPAGTHPHDVAPAPDGNVWYTAQITGALGKLDPETGETRHIPLGSGSSPHGVIVGPDGAPGSPTAA